MVVSHVLKEDRSPNLRPRSACSPTPAREQTASALKGRSSREPDILLLDLRLTPSSGHLGGQGWRRLTSHPLGGALSLYISARPPAPSRSGPEPPTAKNKP